MPTYIAYAGGVKYGKQSNHRPEWHTVFAGRQAPAPVQPGSCRQAGRRGREARQADRTNRTRQESETAQNPCLQVGTSRGKQASRCANQVRACWTDSGDWVRLECSALPPFLDLDFLRIPQISIAIARTFRPPSLGPRGERTPLTQQIHP